MGRRLEREASVKVQTRCRALILPLIMLVLLAACAPWSADATPTARPARPNASATPVPPRYGGKITIGFVGALGDLNPAFAGNALAATFFRPVVEGLFAVNSDGRYEAWLAESIPARGRGISDDGTVVIVRLRQGVAWEDGRALTAEDLRFTHNAVLDPANPFPPDVVAAHAAIRTLDLLDSYTVRLGYDRPLPDTGNAPSFLRAFPVVYPAHLFNGQTRLAGHPYARGPFGTGPFRFREWVPGDHLTLARSPTYRDGGRPYLDEIVYRQFPDQPAAEAARQSGAIDLVLAADTASFVDPLPGFLRGVTFFAGSPPTRSAHEWWRAE
jgi:peptide/nickel transport system substrate-binding protein